ncbi:MAG: antibiotic ABC transporter permease [Ferrovum sp. 37-45-19]|nr:MAG: antibiotic ABC transporter permease [Ferrovum sp. 21-44-67]OYV95559.1 MAG: antibiotic ABC transporter permease [Ferrovum sp. 37-45-19]OZB31599.1 MAG: antibiotic ABC transporter permease [Ferrovum sp. 34-44-207]HQT81879.1 ABC transporter permease [Ferrovaceae bacterium]HQU05813.1 ABC transporter permease [Ferrovaceae bacterium]
MLARIWALIIKEFLALLRDKKSRFVLIGPPLIQLLVFGYASTFDLNHVPFALFNEDSGLASRQLFNRFVGASSFNLTKTITQESDVTRLINQQEVLLVVHIPNNFTKTLLSHHTAQVQIIIDGRNSNTATLALNYVNTIILEFNQSWAKTYHWDKAPSEIIIRSWFNPNLLSRWFIVPGIVSLLTLVITLLVTGLSVAREREQGTFDQLLVTPFRPIEILIGKAIPGLIIGSLEGILVVLLAITWFKVPFMGSITALMIGLVLFLLAAIGVGLMISSMSLTQQQGLLGVFLFLVPAIILSGFATPIANMPTLVQKITLINPMRYFLVIVRGVFLQGDSVVDLWPQFWPLALIAMGSMSCATWLFRYRI